jgi:hypothetical protein
MKKTLQLCLFMLMVFPFNISAQDVYKDGTSLSDLQLNLKNMLELRARFPNIATSRAVSYVPVCFHLVAKDDGTGRVDEAQVLDMLCGWNRFYERNGVDIQFYIKDDFRYINKTASFTSPNSFAGMTSLISQKRSDALNIFMVNTIDGANPNEVILSQYTNRTAPTAEPYSADFILMQNSFTTTPDVLSRASALFFGLVPTNFGSECIQISSLKDSICVPASVACSNGVFIEPERVARTGARANCSRTGDGFCDTPADYYSLIPVSIGTACTYTGKIKDADCVTLAPDINNLLSIWNLAATCSSLTLSIEQKNAIRNNYLNLPQRAYIRSSITPSLIDVTPPTQLTPSTGSTTAFFNSINLDWENVNGASGYIVEVSRLQSFSNFVTPSSTFKFITKTSDFTINPSNTSPTFFVQGTKYYWRVRAYGNYKTCAGVSEVKNFTTGTLNSNAEIEGVSGVLLSPNPLCKTDILTLKMTNPKPFDGEIKVFDVVGKLIKSEKRHFNAGNLMEQINVDKLTNGLFILTIESEKGSINKRFIVQN